MYAIHLDTGEVESFTNYSEALERFADLSENMGELTWFYLSENGETIMARTVS